MLAFGHQRVEPGANLIEAGLGLGVGIQGADAVDDLLAPGLQVRAFLVECPPGIGDSSGQGGGVEMANVGTGALGAAGGIGGPAMLPGMGFKGRSGATPTPQAPGRMV